MDKNTQFVKIYSFGCWYCVDLNNKSIHYMWKKWNKLTKKQKTFFGSFKNMVKYMIAVNS